MLTLEAYIDAAVDEPWRWGRMDCCMFAGNWIVGATGRDPMSSYRGAYDTPGSAMRLIRKRGGLITMTALEMMRCRFVETKTPERGDVGVIRQPGKQAVAGAFVGIFDGRWWLAKSEDGIAGAQHEPAAVWRILG